VPPVARYNGRVEENVRHVMTDDTYSAKTVNWKVGFFFTYAATWLMYMHDPSAAGWLAVAITGVTYVRFHEAAVSAEIRRQFTDLVLILAAVGMSAAVRAGMVGRPSLVLTLLLLFLAMFVIPSLNPRITISCGKRVRRTPRPAATDEEFDWTLVRLRAQLGIPNRIVRLSLRIVAQGLIAVTVSVSGATMVGTLLWPSLSLRVVLTLIDVNLIAAILAKLSFWFRSMTDSDSVAGASSRPVLYLRPFQEDGRLVGLENHAFGCLFGWSGYLATAEKVELRLAKTLRPVGSIVAIVPAGSKQSVRGSVHLTPAAEQWQTVVRRAMRQSAYTIIQLGSTAGIQWEVLCALETTPLDRILFWLPRPFDGAAKETYEELRLTIGQHALLPPWNEGCFVITFRRDGTPEIHRLDRMTRFGGEGRALAAVFEACLRFTREFADALRCLRCCRCDRYAGTVRLVRPLGQLESTESGQSLARCQQHP
jgi:hypothetical protein